VLEEGDLALVVNVAELVGRARAGVSAPSVALAEPDKATARRRILLAEDSHITRQLVARSLAALGYEVAEAQNGRAALALFEAAAPDLVLTDIEMPEMDGIELIRRVRQRPTGQRLPIIVLSSRGSDEDKRRAVQAGADAYLVKSEFSEGALREMLSRRLGR
jgi:two-component system sensor histidine kinase and response regulator WspE